MGIFGALALKDMVVLLINDACFVVKWSVLSQPGLRLLKAVSLELG